MSAVTLEVHLIPAQQWIMATASKGSVSNFRLEPGGSLKFAILATQAKIISMLLLLLALPCPSSGQQTDSATHLNVDGKW